MGQTQDASSKEAAWKHMAPSLLCGGEQLRFRAMGPGASRFSVEQGRLRPNILTCIICTNFKYLNNLVHSLIEVLAPQEMNLQFLSPTFLQPVDTACLKMPFLWLW